MAKPGSIPLRFKAEPTVWLGLSYARRSRLLRFSVEAVTKQMQRRLLRLALDGSENYRPIDNDYSR